MENLLQLLYQSVERFGDRVAFQIREGNTWTRLSFRQLRDTAEALARGMRARGLETGDSVGILSENRPEWGITFFGILRMGGVVVPLDKLLKAPELQNIIEHSDIKLIFASKNLVPTLLETSTTIPIIYFDENPDSAQSLSHLIEIGLHAEVIPMNSTLATTAVMIFTSGTTGSPKGVMLSHGNFLSNVESFSKIFPEDFFSSNFLSILPLNHAFELTGGFLTPLSGGGTVTYQESLKPSQVLQTMKDTETQITLTVPAFLEMLQRNLLHKVNESTGKKKKFDFAMKIAKFFASQKLRRWLFREVHEAFGGQLHYFVSGGAPLSGELQEFFEHLGFTVLQGYGLTETSPVLSVNTIHGRRKNSVGKAIPGIDIKIDHENGSEILAKGPNVMQGYYKNTEATQEVLADDYFKTGDIGYLDAEGYLYISGRKKNMIVSSNGKKIFPEELEEKIKGSTYIKDICVLGRKTGIEEEVIAVVIPDHDKLKADQIPPGEIRGVLWQTIKKVNMTLAEYKRVRDMMIWHKEFPKTTTLKVKRLELLKEIEQFVQEKILT